jgi:hypothetical protein
MSTRKQNKTEMNKQGYYLLDTQKLKDCKGDKSHTQFAKLINVSRNTAIRYVDTINSKYVLVQEKSAKTISAMLNKPISDLIYRRPLPDDREFYESISHGWFIDNTQGCDADEPRKPRWFSERIELHFDAGSTDKNRRLSFKGEIRNCYRSNFAIRAERLADNIFCMLSKADDQRLSFVGIAHLYFSYPDRNLNMLVGTWSGIDSAGYAAVFRWFLTNQPLSKDDIRQFTSDFYIESYFDSNEFHENFSMYSL